MQSYWVLGLKHCDECGVCSKDAVLSERHLNDVFESLTAAQSAGILFICNLGCLICFFSEINPRQVLCTITLDNYSARAWVRDKQMRSTCCGYRKAIAFASACKHLLWWIHEYAACFQHSPFTMKVMLWFTTFMLSISWHKGWFAVFQHISYIRCI